MTLTTWAQENGVLANWTVTFALSQVTTARWDTEEIAVGPFQAVWESYNFRPDIVLVNTYNSTGHHLEGYNRTESGLDPIEVMTPSSPRNSVLVTSRTNFNDSEWEVWFSVLKLQPCGGPGEALCETPEAPAEVVEASAWLAEAAVRAYGQAFSNNTEGDCSGTQNPAPNWGFVSLDTDCRFRIYTYNTWGLYANFAVVGPEIEIHVHHATKERWNSYGYYLGSGNQTHERVGGVIIAHELFHLAEWSVHANGTSWFKAWTEGMATFVQTLFDPPVEAQESSRWFGNSSTTAGERDDGAEHYLRDPSLAFCDRAYSRALFWGFLYWRDRGMDTLHRVIDEMGRLPNNTACEWRVFTSVDRALVGPGSAHNTSREAMADFAVRMWRQDFRWGNNTTDPSAEPTYDFGRYLSLPASSSQTVGDPVTWEVNAWGLRFVRLPTDVSYHLACDADDVTDWVFQLILSDSETGESVEAVDCLEGRAFVADAYQEVVLSVVRARHSEDVFTLELLTT